MDLSVVGLIIGGCLLLIIILITIVIYTIHKLKSRQNYILGLEQNNFSASTYPLLSIEEKETVLMKLAHDENLNMLHRIEKSQLKFGNFLGVYITAIYMI